MTQNITDNDAEISNLSPFPILKCNREGEVIFMNPAFERFLGEAGLGTQDFDKLLPVRYLALVSCALRDRRKHELKRRFQDRTLQFTFVPSKDKDCVIVFINDFTGEEEAKTQWIQAEKMAAIGQLVGGIAHEINTPMGAIHSNNDILKRAIEKLAELLDPSRAANGAGEASKTTPDPQKILTILNEVAHTTGIAAERIIHLVRSLKNFVRLDEAERKIVDIHEGIESTLLLVQHEFKNRIQVTRNYGEVPQIECYPNRLNQVFMNLLVNASQAIPERGEITIRTSTDDDFVKIAISDTGVGIPEEDLPRVFDPGFTTKGVGVGTGLGLSICFKIVQDHHGKIEVQSEIGKGTTFIISLPRDPIKESYAG